MINIPFASGQQTKIGFFTSRRHGENKYHYISPLSRESLSFIADMLAVLCLVIKSMHNRRMSAPSRALIIAIVEIFLVQISEFGPGGGRGVVCELLQLSVVFDQSKWKCINNVRECAELCESN